VPVDLDPRLFGCVRTSLMASSDLGRWLLEVQSRDDETRSRALKEVLRADAATLPDDWPVQASSAAFAMFLQSPQIRVDEDLSTKRLFGPRVDCFSLLLHVYPHVELALVASNAFWAALHYGLRVRETNRQLRKTAVYLFQRALAALRGAASPASPAAVANWSLFCTLLDTLDDAPMHLILEQWPRVAELFSPQASTSRGVSGPGIIPVPSFLSATIPFEWMCVLLDRAFSHEVASVRRLLLQQFLSTEDATAPVTGDGRPIPGLAAHGSPLSLLVPAWFICGPSADVCTAEVGDLFGGSVSAVTVAMPSLLQRCADPIMYRVASFSAALGGFLRSYIMSCSADCVPAAAELVRHILVRSRDLVYSRGGVRSVLAALASCSVSQITHGAQNTVLGPCSLANLRALLMATAASSTRSFAARRYTDALQVIIRWGSPLDAALPDVAHTLASIPAACILPQGHTSGALADRSSTAYAAVSAWLAPLGGGDPSRLAAMFSEALGAYLCASPVSIAYRGDFAASSTEPHAVLTLGETAQDDFSGVPHIPWSAASLARLFVLLPWAEQSGGQCSRDGAASAAFCALQPLLDTLCAMGSHAYMKDYTRVRALMVLQAILSQIWPRGTPTAFDSGVEDLHLSPVSRWGGAPSLVPMLHPITAEFRSAARAVRVAGVLPYVRTFGSVAAPEAAAVDDALWSGLESASASVSGEKRCSRNGSPSPFASVARKSRADPTSLASYISACEAVCRIVQDPRVACEIASMVESQCAHGLSLLERRTVDALDARVAIWTADAGVLFLSPVHDGGYPEPAVTSLSAAEAPLPAADPPGWSKTRAPIAVAHPQWSVAASLGLLRLCMRCSQQSAYGDARDRLVRQALAALEKWNQISGALDPFRIGVGLVQAVNALQALATLGSSGSQRTDSTALSHPAAVLASVLALRFEPPPGVELALPLLLSAGGAVSLACDATAVTWLQIRGLFESCRWAVLATSFGSAMRAWERRVDVGDAPPTSYFFDLPPALATSLLDNAVDALQTATPEYLHVVVSVIGAGLVGSTATASPAASTGEAERSSSHPFVSLLVALHRAMSSRSTPRRALLAFIAAGEAT
jgi:hypothetical protein